MFHRILYIQSPSVFVAMFDPAHATMTIALIEAMKSNLFPRDFESVLVHIYHTIVIENMASPSEMNRCLAIRMELFIDECRHHSERYEMETGTVYRFFPEEKGKVIKGLLKNLSDCVWFDNMPSYFAPLLKYAN